MHVAVTIPNWPEALAAMPDEWLLLSVSNPDTLKVGREAWSAAGRDLARLHTAYRHYDFEYTFSTSWAWNVAHWREQFWKFVDGTYLERHAPLVRWVLEKNEYGDTRHAADPHFEPEKVINAQAAAWVWNNEFRGRTVTNPHDGGHGSIPADCRLVLWNGPVGNDIPRPVAALAVAEDCGLGYHDYIKADINQWPENDGRDPGDWRFHSGRWHYMEQAWGLRPVWVFTEASLYWDTSQGWLSPNCIGGDPARLARILRAHYRDMAGTDAYKQGRVVGEALFGTGAGDAFQLYELDTPTLLELAPMLRDEWRPAPFTGQWTGDETMADLEKIKGWAQEIGVLAAKIEAEAAPPPWWDKPVPYTFKAQPVNPLKLYKNDKVTVSASLNYNGWEIKVTAVDPAGWLKVVDPAGDAADKWLRALDLTPV